MKKAKRKGKSGSSTTRKRSTTSSKSQKSSKKKTTKKKTAKKATKKTTSPKRVASGKKTMKTKKKTAKKKTAKKGTAKKPAVRKTVPAAKKTVAKKVKTTRGILTPAELRECRNMLLHKRALIAGDLSKMEMQALRASEQDSSVDNMADYGTDNYEQDFTLGLIENVEGVILDIDDALERIDDGIYGICEDCGCAIPKARLKALPYARNCVKCQSEREAF